MRFTIIDCYTDEPSGLGVIPYIGTYPRYIAGGLLKNKQEVFYLTIDDVRATVKGEFDYKNQMKTDVRRRNLTPNFVNVKQILSSSDYVIIISGVHTPGKYLSAYPGTTEEISKLLNQLGGNYFTILTGPGASSGSGQWGGRKARDVSLEKDNFNLVIADLEYKLDLLLKNNFSKDVEITKDYNLIEPAIVKGAKIVHQYPLEKKFLIAEIETMSGCARKKGCSFCTEPLKSCGVHKRTIENIVAEVKSLSKEGVKNFRLGKQTCFYSYGDIDTLLKKVKPYAEILHIDNVNPAFVTEEKTKSIVKYCTSGNIASLGVESFDPLVIEKNNLNSNPEMVYKAIKLINKYGAERGDNGLPKFLPGINLLFGLNGESSKTHQENMKWLNKIMDEGLLLRRINLREVVVFPGTDLEKEVGDKFLKKNRRKYWGWKNDIRQNIDYPLLQKLVPEGTVLKNLRAEIYDGKTTFCRQIGTYPLTVGVKGRLDLDFFYDLKVKKHMLRSVLAERL
jgi:radical SAM superfamily enzyme with C-terminal helix-hairpin-helix motif